jgi:large subunit ribosomal protein L33
MANETIVMLFRSWDSVRYEFENNKDMAKKNKDARVQVILECTEQKASGVPGMSRYITTKNKKNTPERLELKKYNPFLKKMTVHKEIK